MCWVMTVGGQLAGNFCRTAISASTPPVDEPMATILRPTRKSATLSGARSSGAAAAAREARWERAAAFTFSARSPNGRRIAAAGLADAIDGAEFEGRKRRVRAAMGQGRHHDHRHRPQPHDLLEEFEAVHVRHLDVERDDVGIERLDRVARLAGVAGLADDLDVRIDAAGSPDQAAHGGGIVDDENAPGSCLRPPCRLRGGRW